MKCISCSGDIRDYSTSCNLCGTVQPTRPAPSAPAGKTSSEDDVDWAFAFKIIGGVALGITLSVSGYVLLL